MSDVWRSVVGGLAALTAGFAAYRLYSYYSEHSGTGVRNWHEVGRLLTIFIHPVKACRGIELVEAECTGLGMRSKEGVYDRHYVIVDGGNRFVTMRQKNALALIRTSKSDDGKSLQLDAPDMPTVRVPLHEAVTKDVISIRIWGLDSQGYSCGEEVAHWLDTYLNTTGYKLVCYTPDLKTHTSLYQDFALFNLFSEASLKELNSRLEAKVKIRNFRPNFVVQGPTAFEEDNWKYIRIGENVILRKSILCGRCKQTSVDPETGIVSDEPLKTLKAYRMTDPSHPDHKELQGAPAFGIYMNLEAEGTVAVGDTVYISH